MIKMNAQEKLLTGLYYQDNRQGTMESLLKMKAVLSAEETELEELTDGVLQKLAAMRDEEFETMDIFPDFSEIGL